ncbi:MAG TPA: DUF493 family protein [Nevskiaceae bacterium]
MGTPPIYPCDFPIKAFMRPDAQAEAALIRRIEAALGPGTRLDVGRRSSAHGRYVCLTLRFRARDAAHARRIGALVHRDERVLMAL